MKIPERTYQGYYPIFDREEFVALSARKAEATASTYRTYVTAAQISHPPARVQVVPCTLYDLCVYICVKAPVACNQ